MERYECLCPSCAEDSDASWAEEPTRKQRPREKKQKFSNNQEEKILIWQAVAKSILRSICKLIHTNAYMQYMSN